MFSEYRKHGRIAWFGGRVRKNLSFLMGFMVVGVFLLLLSMKGIIKWSHYKLNFNVIKNKITGQYWNQFCGWCDTKDYADEYIVSEYDDLPSIYPKDGVWEPIQNRKEETIK